MTREIVLDGNSINDQGDCYVIAEIGHNHQGEVSIAKKMFEAAKDCGVHAVKLQKRDNRNLFTKAAYDRPYDNRNSYGETYGKHREALEFGRNDFLELKRYAGELGLTFFATAFDLESVDFLEEIDLPAYKVASGDLKTIPLLKYMARLGKPMIVSTGGATLEDVRRAFDAIATINPQVALLQCTAAYPVEPQDMNLRVIDTFRKQFPNTVIGLSDHQNGIAMSVLAYALGARIIEKHFTLNRALKGTDHAFSLEPGGLSKLVRDLSRARLAMGDGQKRMLPSEEEPILKMGKKLVAARNLAKGTKLELRDIAIKSPGDGLPAFELDRVLGRYTRNALQADENIEFDVLE